MANIDLYLPRLLKWEGGFVNDPADRGGATNKGVTIATWRQVGYDKDGDGDIDVADLRLLSTNDVRDRVLRPHYWNRWRADQIENQSLAELLVEWVWGSGKWGVILPQRVLGVVDDGKVGPATIRAVNNAYAPQLHAQLVTAKVEFLNALVRRDPVQKRFINGWLRRINDFPFKSYPPPDR